jgi:hypothetical protein
MTNVVSFPGASTKRMEQLKADGRAASRKMLGKTVKLHPEDRHVIARRLNDEIEKSGIKPGRLAVAADLINGTRELDKMRWRQGNKQDKELLGDSSRYRDVIAALAKLTGENFNLLLDRVTVGTRVHPRRASHALSDIEKTQVALELEANEVDRELDLLADYRHTLRLKCEGFARGELANWPYYDLDEDAIPESTTDPEAGDYEEYIREEWDAQVAGQYGFWGYDFNDDYLEGIDIESLCCLPHAYLGILVNWTHWTASGDLNDIRKLREWMTLGYTHTPTAGYRDGEPPRVENLTVKDPDILEGSPYAGVNDFPHAWLTLFPDREMTRIVPALLELSADLGSTLRPISPRVLVELESTEIIGRQPRAYDAIVELLAPEQGKSLRQQWTETGRWFRENPFLRRANRAARARCRRDKLLSTGD